MTVLIFILSLLAVMPFFTFAENDVNLSELHDKHHHPVAEVKLQLNDGKKWPIDDSLHQGMSAIKSSINTNLSKIHHDEFSIDEYKALADDIDQQILYIFKHCQLPTDADIQLHVILMDALAGIQTMRSSEQPRAGAIKIIGVLKNYGKYFDDKSWTPLFH